MKKRGKKPIALVLCIMLGITMSFGSLASADETQTGNQNGTGVTDQVTEPNTDQVADPNPAEEPKTDQSNDQNTVQIPKDKTIENTRTQEKAQPVNKKTNQKAVAKAAALTSSNLKDYIDSADIYVSGEKYDPADALAADGSFDIKLTFSEIANGAQARQFPDNGIMTYQMPSNITGFDAVVDAPIKDTNSGNKIGTYTISTAGLITIKMNPDYVAEYANIKAFLTFEASFKASSTEDKEEVEIIFSDDVSVKVKIEDKISLSVAKKFVGSYDIANNTFNCQFTVNALEGKALNVVARDEMSDNVILDQNSIAVMNNKNQAVNFTGFKYIDGSNNKKWQINLGDMSKGDVYIVSYKVKFVDSVFAEAKKLGGINYDLSATAKNTVYVKADNVAEISHSASATVKFRWGNKGVMKTDGKLKWTVTVNPQKFHDISGYTVRDKLTAAALSYITGSGTLVVKKNDSVIETVDLASYITTSGADAGRSWEYKLPSNAGKNSYTFEYYTNVPTNTSLISQKYGNSIDIFKDDEHHEGSKSYEAKGIENGLTKTAGEIVNVDGVRYIPWTSTITVPKEGLSNVRFYDGLTHRSSKPHEFVDPLTVSKVPGNTGYGIVNVTASDGVDLGNIKLVKKSNNKEFNLYFGTDTAVQTNSKLPESDKDYTITIKYYSKVTSDENGVRWNRSYLYLNNDYIYAEAEKTINTKIELKKIKSSFEPATGEITWIVAIDTARAGLPDEDIIVDDIFSDNQTYVEGSAYTSYGTSAWWPITWNIQMTPTVTKVSDTNYKFNLGKCKAKDLNGTPYIYGLVYKTKVKDAALQQNGVVRFDNKANVKTSTKDFGTVSDYHEISNTIIDKKLAQQPTQANGYEAGYEITVNPNKALLNSKSAEEANDYTITDEHSKAVTVDLNSIKITKNGIVMEKTDYKVVPDFSGTDKNKITITLPKADGSAYVITYKAIIRGTVGSEVTFENNAKITVVQKYWESHTSDRVVIKDQRSNAGASGSKLAFAVYKYDSANSNKALPGAVFELYKDSVAPANLIGTQTTGPEGKATFGQLALGNNLTLGGEQYYLESGVKYILVEKSAPESYEVSKERIEFQLLGENDPLADITTYAFNSEIQIANTKCNFSIKKADSTNGDVLSGAEFTLFSDAACSADAKVQTATESSTGIHSFKGLKYGTYYMKETVVPAGYIDTGKIYTVEVKNDGTVVIDGTSLGSSLTFDIANDKQGKISVTKEVKVINGDTLVNKDFYVTLFTDKEMTQKYGVEPTKKLEIKDSVSTTVTYENLPHDTYYIAETYEDGTPIGDPSEIGAESIEIDKDTVTIDPSNLEENVKLTNSFKEEDDYLYGSVKVTKEVVINGEGTATKGVFYTALFSDENTTQRVTEVKALEMNGQISTSVEFDQDLAGNRLQAGTVYYVAETDKDGNAISDPTEIGADAIDIENSAVEITPENIAPEAKITNRYEDQHYDSGELVLNKVVTYNGEDYKTNDTFYVALFKDKEHKELVSDVMALEMNGNSKDTVTFTDLAIGDTFYIAETNAEGKALSEAEAAELGYAMVLSADKTVIKKNEPSVIKLDNQINKKYKKKHPKKKGDSSRGMRTGDDSNIVVWLITTMLAGFILIAVIFGKRKKE